MHDSESTRFRISRRALLTAGLAGGTALLVARWLYAPSAMQPPASGHVVALDAEGKTILAAIVPVFLADACEAASGLAEAVAGVERAIAGLSPATRAEVADLFSLLAFPPTRCLVAGIWSPWPQATPEAIAAFLARWRNSRFALLRSGYAALHQLVFSGWYANPRAWPVIGYPGPPSLEIG